MKLPIIALLLLLVGCDTRPRLSDTTRLGNTFDLAGPYLVQTAVTGTAAPDAVELVLRTPGDEEPGAVSSMEAIGVGLYEGRIAGQAPFTQVRYRVRLRDGDETQVEPRVAGDDGWFGFWVLGLPCTSALDCSPGEYCHSSGTCRAAQGTCRVDDDCTGGRECGPGGRCRPPIRACGACTLGEVCSTTSGGCVPRPRCDDGLACPLDFLCERHAGQCRRVCTEAADCNRGESCRFGLCSEG